MVRRNNRFGRTGKKKKKRGEIKYPLGPKAGRPLPTFQVHRKKWVRVGGEKYGKNLAYD